MQVLFVMWLLLSGMKDVMWQGGLEEQQASVPSGTTEVVASEGPVGPPPPKP